jgi:hypothetical protein
VWKTVPIITARSSRQAREIFFNKNAEFILTVTAGLSGVPTAAGEVAIRVPVRGARA